MSTTQSIRFLSHPGSRGRTPFERTVPVFDTSTLREVATITREAGKNDWGEDTPQITEHFYLAEDGAIWKGEALETALTDVERSTGPDGVLTVAFDGHLPDDGGCTIPELEANEHLLFRRIGHTRAVFTVAVRVVDKGYYRYEDTFTLALTHRGALPGTEQEPGTDQRAREKWKRRVTDLDVRSDEGIAGLATRGISMVIHDETFADIPGYLRAESAQASAQLLSLAEQAEAAAKSAREIAAGDFPALPAPLPSSQSMEDATDRVLTLNYLLAQQS